MLQKLPIIIILILINILSFAQEEAESKFVKKTFRGTRLINTQTVENIPQGAFEFNLQHRFGMADLNDRFLKDFMGLDKTANIRFGFAFPVTDRLLLGIGRTKYQKTFDFEGKYILLKQTKDNKIPISLAVYENVFLRSSDYSRVDESEFKSRYRLSNSSQLIIARKFNDWLSLQISPTYIHRNLVEDYEENNMFALPIAGRIKTSIFSSVVFEYAPVFNKPNFETSNMEIKNPFSIAYEYQTASHVFQVIIGSTFHILDHQHYTTPYRSSSILDGQFYLGFNMSRTFWFNKSTSPF